MVDPLVHAEKTNKQENACTREIDFIELFLCDTCHFKDEKEIDETAFLYVANSEMSPVFS